MRSWRLEGSGRGSPFPTRCGFSPPSSAEACVLGVTVLRTTNVRGSAYRCAIRARAALHSFGS